MSLLLLSLGKTNASSFLFKKEKKEKSLLPSLPPIDFLPAKFLPYMSRFLAGVISLCLSLLTDFTLVAKCATAKLVVGKGVQREEKLVHALKSFGY